MPFSLADQLVVALSSRALFDFEEENRVFEEEHDDQAYMQLQLERLEQAAKPGVAFQLVRELLAFNTDGHRRVEVVILSRNDPVSGLRVFRSAQRRPQAAARGIHAGPTTVPVPDTARCASLPLGQRRRCPRAALQAGFPAARVFAQSRVAADRHAEELRIAFDGDAVLFSDEAEQVPYQAEGLDRFQAHEQIHVKRPLPAGPFKPLLEALQRLQNAADSAPVRLRARRWSPRAALRRMSARSVR